MEHRSFQIGSINYFGYGGLPLEKIQVALPLRIGDALTFASFSKKPIADVVLAIIGKQPTDVQLVCCDSSQHVQLFIGLPGSSFHLVSAAPVPSGDAQLDAEGLKLYREDQTALAEAVARGQAGEDDSLGYAVSNDPLLRAINLKMRTYALAREQALSQVLQTANDSTQRRAAAELLGYVRRSTTQLQTLSHAIDDPDEEVRNNVVRALAVLSSTPGANPLPISMKPLKSLFTQALGLTKIKQAFSCSG